MAMRFTVLLVCCLAGALGYSVPRQADILSEEEIDDISDSSSDIILGTQAQAPVAMIDQEEEESEENSNEKKSSEENSNEKKSSEENSNEKKSSEENSSEEKDEILLSTTENDEEETNGDGKTELPESVEENDSKEDGTPVPPPTDTVTEDKNDKEEPDDIMDPKIFGLNIGLHYILADINRRLITGERVYLESLIKALVMTHKIEKIGGTLDNGNRKVLRNVAKLFPASLKEALTSD